LLRHQVFPQLVAFFDSFPGTIPCSNAAQDQAAEVLMSGESVLGAWLLFGACLGTTRAVLKYRNDPVGWSWLIEGVCSVCAFGAGAMFLGHAVAITLIH
jgi:hypothetical protein